MHSSPASAHSPSSKCDDLGDASVLNRPEVLNEQSIVGQRLFDGEVADARLVQGVFRQWEGLAIVSLSKMDFPA